MRVSIDDYLRTVYDLFEKQKNKEGVKAIDVAKNLNVSKPSVSAMIKKLIKLRYLKAKPYSKIHFTKKGLEEAKRLVRNHRVIGVFLEKIFKYDVKKVHEEAHRLEHAFSQESIKKLDSFLKNQGLSTNEKMILH